MSVSIRNTKLSLIGAMLDAPLMAVSARWPKTIHAVDMEQVIKGWERQTYKSACGKSGLRFVGVDTEDGEFIALWPPRLKGLPPSTERCQDCFIATGRMRPRTAWNKREDAA